MRILVTGGTGDLGKELVPRLAANGHEVRVLSRRERPGLPSGVRAIRGDLITGDGVTEAVGGVDTIVHCATGARDTGLRGLTYRTSRRTDVEPTKALLEVAKLAGDLRFVYISIVGVDRIPLGYYRAKLDSERAIAASGLTYTILRTTQWHTLGWEFCRRFAQLPAVVVPRGVRSQLLDPSEVAERMASLIETGASGRVPDMGGPEALEFREIVRRYLLARHKHRAVAQLTIPGKAMAGFRAGHNLCPDHADGRITWDEWLAKRVAGAAT